MEGKEYCLSWCAPDYCPNERNDIILTADRTLDEVRDEVGNALVTRIPKLSESNAFTSDHGFILARTLTWLPGKMKVKDIPGLQSLDLLVYLRIQRHVTVDLPTGDTLTAKVDARKPLRNVLHEVLRGTEFVHCAAMLGAFHSLRPIIEQGEMVASALLRETMANSEDSSEGENSASSMLSCVQEMGESNSNINAWDTPSVKDAMSVYFFDNARMKRMREAQAASTETLLYVKPDVMAGSIFSLYSSQNQLRGELNEDKGSQSSLKYRRNPLWKDTSELNLYEDDCDLAILSAPRPVRRMLQSLWQYHSVWVRYRTIRALHEALLPINSPKKSRGQETNVLREGHVLYTSLVSLLPSIEWLGDFAYRIREDPSEQVLPWTTLPIVRGQSIRARNSAPMPPTSQRNEGAMAVYHVKYRDIDLSAESMKHKPHIIGDGLVLENCNRTEGTPGLRNLRATGPVNGAMSASTAMRLMRGGSINDRSTKKKNGLKLFKSVPLTVCELMQAKGLGSAKGMTNTHPGLLNTSQIATAVCEVEVSDDTVSEGGDVSFLSRMRRRRDSEGWVLRSRRQSVSVAPNRTPPMSTDISRRGSTESPATNGMASDGRRRSLTTSTAMQGIAFNRRGSAESPGPQGTTVHSTGRSRRDSIASISALSVNDSVPGPGEVISNPTGPHMGTLGLMGKSVAALQEVNASLVSQTSRGARHRAGFVHNYVREKPSDTTIFGSVPTDLPWCPLDLNPVQQLHDVVSDIGGIDHPQVLSRAFWKFHFHLRLRGTSNASDVRNLFNNNESLMSLFVSQVREDFLEGRLPVSVNRAGYLAACFHCLDVRNGEVDPTLLPATLGIVQTSPSSESGERWTPTINLPYLEEFSHILCPPWLPPAVLIKAMRLGMSIVESLSVSELQRSVLEAVLSLPLQGYDVHHINDCMQPVKDNDKRNVGGQGPGYQGFICIGRKYILILNVSTSKLIRFQRSPVDRMWMEGSGRLRLWMADLSSRCSTNLLVLRSPRPEAVLDSFYSLTHHTKPVRTTKFRV
eukprot:Clim_evm104s156 gene=Clim_evmTU104s156